GDLALADLHHAEDRLEEGRLAGPVRADDADQLALAGDQVGAVEDVHSGQVAGVDVGELDDDVAVVRSCGLADVLAAGRGVGHDFSSSSSSASAADSIFSRTRIASVSDTTPMRPVTSPRSTSWCAPRYASTTA